MPFFPDSPVPVLELPRPTNPQDIPLPPSPMMMDDEEPGFDQVDTHINPSMVSGPSLKQVRQVGMLSLAGVSPDEAEEDEVIRRSAAGPSGRIVEEEEEVEEEDEEGDTFQPLAPIRIAGSTTSGSTRSLSPATPITPSVQTPISPADDRRFAGSSPPRKAPIGTGVGLARKESKWRKSVYGLSDVCFSCGPSHYLAYLRPLRH
jgi:hypothetical protein